MDAARIARTTAALVCLLGVATGCGGDEPAAEPPATRASSPSADGSTSTSASPSDEPSETSGTTGEPTLPDTYDVAPASGPPVQLEQLTAAMPAGWAPSDPDDRALTAISPDFRETILFSSRPGLGGPPLEEGPARFNQSAGYPDELPTQPDVVIDGQEWWHVAGSTGGDRVEAFGTTAPGGNDVVVTFEFRRTPEQRRTETLGSVLASVQLG